MDGRTDMTELTVAFAISRMRLKTEHADPKRYKMRILGLSASVAALNALFGEGGGCVRKVGVY